MNPADGSASASAAQKRTIRAEMRARLGAMSTAERQAASGAIRDALRAWLGGARSVVMFAPMPTEPDVMPLAQELLDRGVVVGFPRVDWESGEMVARVVRTLAELEVSRGGVREPSADAAVLRAPDAVLVPGVAFDDRGMRLGRGGGHYDRYLSGIGGARTCGVAFGVQRVERLPRDAWDVSVRALVTERGVTSFS